MARYISDQNKLGFKFESGTYGNQSGAALIWLGQVTEHTLSDNENIMIDRYLGTGKRNFDYTNLGPIDITGTINYNLQDARMLFWAIGSVRSTSGTNSVHTLSEVNNNVSQSPWVSGLLNPPVSFEFEDSKQAPGTNQNFVRTVNGACINTFNLNLSQGEKVTGEIGYVGQSITFRNNSTSGLTEVTTKPYLWSDATLTISGTTINTAKEITLEINQNMEAPHYINGSRAIAPPFPQNREYTLNVTMDLDSATGSLLYNNLYKENAAFNTILELNKDTTAGSQHVYLLLSGCRITGTPGIPSTMEGATEATFQITPQYIIGSSWDSSASASKYGPW